MPMNEIVERGYEGKIFYNMSATLILKQCINYELFGCFLLTSGNVFALCFGCAALQWLSVKQGTRNRGTERGTIKPGT